MAETTYHKDKLYVPKEVREKLGLTDGDKMEIEVTGQGEARMRVMRRVGATERLIEWLDSPPINGVVKRKLSRREIYEDHP